MLSWLIVAPTAVVFALLAVLSPPALVGSTAIEVGKLPNCCGSLWWGCWNLQLSAQSHEPFIQCLHASSFTLVDLDDPSVLSGAGCELPWSWLPMLLLLPLPKMVLLAVVLAAMELTAGGLAESGEAAAAAFQAVALQGLECQAAGDI